MVFLKFNIKFTITKKWAERSLLSVLTDWKIILRSGMAINQHPDRTAL
jgi:hypothetical protein